MYRSLLSFILLAKNEDGSPKYPGLYEEWATKWTEDNE
jgi:hypothetical protein